MEKMEKRENSEMTKHYEYVVGGCPVTLDGERVVFYTLEVAKENALSYCDGFPISIVEVTRRIVKTFEPKLVEAE